MVKTYQPFETDGAERVSVAETILLVSLYTGDGIVYRNSQAIPSNELGTHFFPNIKQAIMAKDRLFRDVALKHNYVKRSILRRQH